MEPITGNLRHRKGKSHVSILRKKGENEQLSMTFKDQLDFFLKDDGKWRVKVCNFNEWVLENE